MLSFWILIAYLFGILDPVNLEHACAKLHELDPGIKEIAMTAAEYLEEKVRRATVRKLLQIKFQALDDAYEARLAAASREALDRYLERVLAATTLAAVFED